MEAWRPSARKPCRPPCAQQASCPIMVPRSRPLLTSAPPSSPTQCEALQMLPPSALPDVGLTEASRVDSGAAVPFQGWGLEAIGIRPRTADGRPHGGASAYRQQTGHAVAVGESALLEDRGVSVGRTTRLRRSALPPRQARYLLRYLVQQGPAEACDAQPRRKRASAIVWPLPAALPG